MSEGKSSLKLYCLVHDGADGPCFSSDYPAVFRTHVEASRYLNLLPEVKIPIYRIMEFIPKVQP